MQSTLKTTKDLIFYIPMPILDKNNKVRNILVPNLFFDVLTKKIMEVAMVAIPCMCHFDSISTRHFSLGVDCPGCHAKITKIYMDAPTQSFIDLWLKEKHNVPTFEESIALGNIENTNSNSFQKVFQVNIPTIFVNTPYDSTIKKTMAMVPCMCRYDSSNEIYLPRCFKCKSEIKETYPDPYFDKLIEIWQNNIPSKLPVAIPKPPNFTSSTQFPNQRMVWTPLPLPPCDYRKSVASFPPEIINEKCIPLLRYEINRALLIWACIHSGDISEDPDLCKKYVGNMREGVLLRLNKLKETMDLPIIDKVISFISARPGQQIAYLQSNPDSINKNLHSGSKDAENPPIVFLTNRNRASLASTMCQRNNPDLKKFNDHFELATRFFSPSSELLKMINEAIILFNHHPKNSTLASVEVWEAIYMIVVLAKKFECGLLKEVAGMMMIRPNCILPILKNEVNDKQPSTNENGTLNKSVSHSLSNKRKLTEDVVIDEDLKNQLLAIAKKQAISKNNSDQNDECTIM